MDWIFALIYFPPDAWLRAVLCFVLCALLLPLLIPAARRLQLVDHPGGRKQHDGAIPVIGGLVICAVATLSFGLFENFPNVRVAVFSFCMLMLVVVGQLDDRIDLAWPWRIGAQTLAALLVLLFFVLIAGWFQCTRDHALAVARLSRLHPSSSRRDVTA